MTAVNRTALYQYFLTNSKPTQSQFANLIDSCLNLVDTSAQVITSDISANGRLTVNNAIVVGSALGGDKGPGTVNATGLYVNGTLVTTTSAGSGTVNVGVSGQIAYYASNSNSVAGTNTLPDDTVATTRTAGTSNTQIATCGFANPAFTASQNGYQKFPSGIIQQWGRLAFNASGYANVAFPIPFPNNVFTIVATVFRGGVLESYVMSTQIGIVTNASASIYGAFGNPGGFGSLTSNEAADWIAIGN